MSIFPPKPPSRVLMTKKEAYKRLNCALWHQKEWKSYVVGVDPRVDLAVCSKCGVSHVTYRGFTTEEDMNRKIDKTLKVRLP